MLLAPAAARADEFDRFDGPALNRAIREPETRGREGLTVPELGALPRVLKDQRAAVLAVRTTEGNPARLRVAPAFRKSPHGGDPLPILVVERLETFEAGPATSRLAQGKDVVLFDGFRLDLDTGQIVPEGQGGDLQYSAEGGGRLVALDTARLFLIDEVPQPTGPAAARPAAGRGVQPSDVSGRYHLAANGQWSGLLELKAEAGGRLGGRFRSDQTGASYPVSGQVGGDAPNQVRFAIDFPRSSLEFQGRIWTEGKDLLSGLVTLQRREFGFVAIREGAQLPIEGLALPMADRPAESPGRVEVRLAADGAVQVAGRAVAEPDLGETLQDLARRDSEAQVLLAVDPATPYDRLAGLLARLHEAGFGDLRLKPIPRDESPR